MTNRTYRTGERGAPEMGNITLVKSANFDLLLLRPAPKETLKNYLPGQFDVVEELAQQLQNLRNACQYVVVRIAAPWFPTTMVTTMSTVTNSDIISGQTLPARAHLAVQSRFIWRISV